MAKRGTKVRQARKTDVSDDSLLVRSAESLGRVIGLLQRQVQGSSKRISSMADDAIEALPELPRFDGFGAVVPRRTLRKRTTARKPAARKAKTTRKTAGGRKRAAARKTSKKR